MNVAIIDADKTRFPNLALMKLSAWHKSQGDSVEWHFPMLQYDRTYCSKVFTYTPKPDMPQGAIVGGIGFNNDTLPDAIEHIAPDYSLYGVDYALGFTTRGCPNKCGFCVVPAKEGNIRENAPIEEFWHGQKSLVLLDNNILAHPHGLCQLEVIAGKRIALDCNQGIDARLVTDDVARLLAKVRWTRFVRFACDSQAQKQSIADAIVKIRRHRKGVQFFAYVLVRENEITDALDRVQFLTALRCEPFAQSLRTETNTPSAEQKAFCRWVNRKAIYKTTSWQSYGQQVRGKWRQNDGGR